MSDIEKFKIAVEEFKKAILTFLEPICRPILDFLSRIIGE